MNHSLRWWQESVIYQLVVPSFLDTNGDGIGDLRGVIERLEYLQWLGIQAIWLSPIYTSPMSDLGYDVSDFTSIDPRFGTLDDFDQLLAEAHRRDLKIILDWVPNHTSAEHPWFVSAASSRDDSKRDWYVWRDGRDDNSPPNNWISVFGGSTWQWHEPTGQFYLHHFLAEQPDLNWWNPEVEAAMFDTLRFWLDRGVDGFRVDALDLLLEDPDLRDNPPNPDYREGHGPDSKLLPQYTRDQQGIHEIVARMRSVLDEYQGDRLLAGELYLPIEQSMAYYGRERPELHLPLNLKLAWVEWNAADVLAIIQQYCDARPADGWPTWTLSTHDCPRLAVRCQGEHTRLAAMLLLTLDGTPTHYYGEEVGMQGVPIPPESAVDPQGRRTGRNRDPERTPMQWSTEQHAGFSTVEPWLPIADDYREANTMSQTDNPRSLLTLYRRLIALRREHRLLVVGRLEIAECECPIVAYRRQGDGEHMMIVLNLGGEPLTFRFGESAGRIVLSTCLDREAEEVHEEVELRGGEGVVISGQ